ncbi:hypothetical protein DFH07DRAFT_790351 [Mycena maculata]|uniref:DUF7918 domain-containing protein n=1 Tax=Mycena maculata TaxID=230809 RepID=A0AAD7KD98_9AGAR|nr:hypothetical protein DFH07DRAFT_790351 [Mycena maculata]
MPQSNGFSAWVSIEGVKAEEFDVQTVDKTTTCWIPSEVGKRFSVHWSNLAVPGMTGGRVLVDGNNCDGQILARAQRPTSTSMAGINEITSVRPFVFSSLDVADDDAVLESDSHERLGMIELEIWKVKRNDADPSTWTGVPAPLPKSVHERSKKAVSQQISFCDPVPRQPVKVVSCRWTNRIVKFSFLYRPLDLLRANGIAPSLRDKGKRKAASPECGLSDDDDSDAEEARLLETRLSEIRAKRANKNPRKRKIKAEDESAFIDLTRPRKKIKLEDHPPVFRPAEIIDLT